MDEVFFFPREGLLCVAQLQGNWLHCVYSIRLVVGQRWPLPKELSDQPRIVDMKTKSPNSTVQERENGLCMVKQRKDV